MNSGWTTCLSVAQALLPGVLLVYAPRWRGYDDRRSQVVVQVLTTSYAILVLLVEFGAFSLLMQAQPDRMSCGMGVAPLVMLGMLLMGVAVVTGLAFAVWLALKMDQSRDPSMWGVGDLVSAMVRFPSALAISAALFSPWLTPLLSAGKSPPNVLVFCILPVISTLLTVLLVRRMSTSK